MIESSEPVAEWLQGKLIFEESRPVQLRQGILTDGAFHYHEFNGGFQRKESFSAITGETEAELIESATTCFAGRGEMTLLFCSTKDESFYWANTLSDNLSLFPATKALEELELLEENMVSEKLKDFLNSGVAVHNSDLTWSQRRLIERAAARGEILILCSTSTLGEGVNLPVVNCLVPRTLYQIPSTNKNPVGPPGRRPLSNKEFRNMTGRSARLGRAKFPLDENQTPYGRGMITSPSV